jgi:phosphatidylglycerol:prolipoprotein diacylglycerol transferase
MRRQDEQNQRIREHASGQRAQLRAIGRTFQDMGISGGLGGGLIGSFGYIVINIDPVLLRLGPLAIHWYGLMYVVAIVIGLWAVMRWAQAMGLHEEQIWNPFLAAAIAGLVGGRLYYVVQQPDLWQHFILQPYNIIAVWDGGMAFFGAVFLAAAALFVAAGRSGINPWLALDGGALFAAVGQIFGRVGNIVNGDIVGLSLSHGPIHVPAATCATAPCIGFVRDPSLPWYAMVYLNPNAFHQTFVPYIPAAPLEICINILMLFILWQVRYFLPRLRAGYFFTLYLAMYAVSQIGIFFWRDNVITPFLGINFLKQAQWTGIFVLAFAVPALWILIRRYSEPWRYTASKPVPWPLASGGKGIMPAKPAVAAAQGPASSGTTDMANDVRSEDAELPPWEPAHPEGGQLRNVFGGPRPSSGTT